MSFAERWLRRPQNTRAYKVVFQIHLWAGLLLGLYIVVECASGSAIVFRNNFYDVFEAWNKAGATPLESRVIHAGYTAMKWCGDLHSNLLLGGRGIIVNAVGGFLVSALCVTGLIVWWPGIATWRRGMGIRLDVGWKRMVFDLHKATGFWIFGFVFMWGMTGGYFVYPQPFRTVVNWLAPIDAPVATGTNAPGVQPVPRMRTRRTPRPLTTGGKILRGFSAAHEGTFGGLGVGGLGVKALWFVLGLAPTVLVLTAVLMWWNRVLHPWLLKK